MSDLKGKVAVVTGASKGIGAAIARSMSAAGAAVVVNYSSSKEDADRVVGVDYTAIPNHFSTRHRSSKSRTPDMVQELMCDQRQPPMLQLGKSWG